MNDDLTPPTQDPADDELGVGKIVTYAGRTGIVLEVHEHQADGSDYVTPAGVTEHAYRVAYFPEVSDPIPAHILNPPATTGTATE